MNGLTTDGLRICHFCHPRQYLFVERSCATFQRTIRLPFPVDPEQVRASFDNGVLTVTLPKTRRPERSRNL